MRFSQVRALLISVVLIADRAWGLGGAEVAASGPALAHSPGKRVLRGQAADVDGLEERISKPTQFALSPLTGRLATPSLRIRTTGTVREAYVRYELHSAAIKAALQQKKVDYLIARTGAKLLSRYRRFDLSNLDHVTAIRRDLTNDYGLIDAAVIIMLLKSSKSVLVRNMAKSVEQASFAEYFAKKLAPEQMKTLWRDEKPEREFSQPHFVEAVLANYKRYWNKHKKSTAALP